MSDVKVDRIQKVSQVQFRVIIEAAATKPLVTICNGPRDHVPNRVVIKVQVERNRVIEPDIFSKDRVSFDHAKGKCNGSPVLAPDEETDFVRHCVSKPAEIFFGQLFEMKLRAFVDLQIERVYFINNGRDVVYDAHLDRCGPCCGSEFLA